MDSPFGSEKSHGDRRQTCRQCRQRKVRCDGKLPFCHNCERLGFTCTFQARLDRGPDLVIPIPGKLRGSRACVECRLQKTRCSGTSPQCNNCLRRGKSCVYPQLKRPIRHADQRSIHAHRVPLDINSNNGSTGPSPDSQDLEMSSVLSGGDKEAPVSSATPPTNYGMELIETFFERVYPLPTYSFLHPRTTKEKFMDGNLEECLMLGLCAVAALHLESGLPVTEARPSSQWVDLAEDLIWQHFESPSIPRLQGLLLCVHYRMEITAYERAFMLLGIAARAATAMRLNHERTDLDSVSAEVRRRCVWCLKFTASYFSIGLPEFELLPFETVYLDMPGPEDDFQRGTSASDLGSMVARDSGERKSLHFCCRLAIVRRDVMKLMRSLALYNQPFAPLGKLIESLVSELAHIRNEMGIDTESFPHELARFINTPWISRHVLMHLSIHQCHTDLFRLLLPRYPDAAPPIALSGLDPDLVGSAEGICLHHASSIIQILSDLNQRCTSAHRLEFDSAICGYHASRMLLFISRSGSCRDRPSPEFAISRVELCLAAIKRFYRASTLVQPIVDDMERMITTFGPNNDSPDGIHPPELTTDRRDPALKLTGPARARQGLEIHSLLRRSGFFDDSYADSSTSPSSTDSGSTARRQMIVQQIAALSSRVLDNGQARSARQHESNHHEETDIPQAPTQYQASFSYRSDGVSSKSLLAAQRSVYSAPYPWMDRHNWTFESSP